MAMPAISLIWWAVTRCGFWCGSENDKSIRAAVCEYLGYLGVKIDPEKNAQRGFENKISTEALLKLYNLLQN